MDIEFQIIEIVITLRVFATVYIWCSISWFYYEIFFKGSSFWVVMFLSEIIVIDIFMFFLWIKLTSMQETVVF